MRQVYITYAYEWLMKMSVQSCDTGIVILRAEI